MSSRDHEISSPATPGNSQWRRHFLLILALVGAAIAAYSNSFAGAFLFDDEGEIVNNERIKSVDPVGLLRRNSSRPLVDLSLQLNYAAGGLRTWGYHAVNLGVHILAGLALFGLVRRLAGLKCDARRAEWFAFVVALAWLVHPLNTQAVTYVIQRSESMMGLCYLLTLYCFVRGAEGPEMTPSRGDRASVIWWLAAVGCCAAGMACKGVMVTAPIAVGLCDYVFFSGHGQRRVPKRILLYTGLLASWLILMWLGVLGGAIAAKGSPLATVGFGYGKMGAMEYLRTQAGVIPHYLRLVVWPAPLCLDYEWPVAKSFSEYGPQGIAVLLLLGGAIWGVFKKSPIGFAMAMFLLVLAPTSSIVPIKDVIFEHRMYLSLAAVLCICVWVGHRMLSRAGLKRWEPVGASVVVLALGIMTWQRNRVYQSTAVMWSDVLAQQPQSARAHTNLGHALFLEGNMNAAMEHFRLAIRERPQFVAAHYNLANLLSERGQRDEAIFYYREARKWAPHEILSAIMLANVLTDQQKYEDAATELTAGIAKADPNTAAEDLARAHFNLGNTLGRLGRLDAAEGEYRRCLEIAPYHAKAHYGIGWTYQVRGRIKDAIAEYRISLSLRGDDQQVQEALKELLTAHPAEAGRP
jgi:Flp pilus assembly protein TadD